MALSDILAALEIMGEKPAEVVVIGIQPKDLGTGLEMSDLISSQLDTLVQQVVDRLSELGYPPVPLAH
jgi:hydrogenase maturation protease